MESLFTATLSFVILVPIIYFLPLGFTTRGKVTVLAISFLLGNFGLVAKGTFPLWQAVALMILLVFLTGILLDSRLKKMLYNINLGSNENPKVIFVEKEALEIQKRNTTEVDSDTQLNLNSEPVEDILIFEKDSSFLVGNTPDEMPKVELFDINEIDLELENEISLVNNNTEVEEMIVEAEQQSSNLEVDDMIDFDEDISFLLNRDDSILGGKTDKEAFIEDSIPEDVGYMSEIERLLEDNDSIEELLEIPSLKIELSDVPGSIPEDGEQIQVEDIPRLNLEEIAAGVDDQPDLTEKMDIPMLQLRDNHEKALSKETEQVEENMDWDEDIIEPIKQFPNK